MMFKKAVLGALAATLVSHSALADVSSSRVSVPKGPGSIEGLASAEVRPTLSTGTANYAVPIELPPSARGFSPKLSFSYNSGGGVSELGIGWRLSGVAKIERRKNEGLPHFDERDTFGLVGLGTPSDLVEVAPGEYRPQYEDGSFLRVWKDGEEWRVRTKSGVTLHFGGRGYTESEEDHVASYLLREQVDLRGNRIKFEWNTEGGYALLERVIWNDFSKEARNEVVVHHETRPDPSTLFSAGIRQRLDKRIEKIEVLHGGELVRRYEPHYSRDAHPRLEELELVGADGESSLPAAHFEYSGAHLALDGSSGSAELVTIEGAPGRSPGEANASLADLNGDALPDLLIAEAGAYRSYINLDGASFATGQDWTAEDSPSVSLSASGIQLADVDGDGAIDLLAKSGTSSFRYFAAPQETSFAEVRTIPTVPNISWEDANTRLVDIDGDRRTDALYTDSTGLYVAYNQKGEDWALPELVGPIDEAQELLFASKDVELCDINGDSLRDLCVLRSGSLQYYLGRGRGLFEEAQNGKDVPVFYSGERFRMLDLNGDGWDDLVRVGTERVFYALATGEGVYAEVQEIEGVPSNADGAHVEFADMNGSGTTDILWVNVTGDDDKSWQYLELFPEGRAGLLTKVENGLGKVQRLQYAPAARFAAQAREEGHPWATRINTAMPVVSRISVDSSLGDPLLVTDFAYENGVYDASERTFAGFEVSITTAFGDETTPTLVTEEHYDNGLDHRGLRGVTTFSEQRTAEGAVFSRSAFNFTYTENGTGLDGTSIDYGYRSSVLTETVEGRPDEARITFQEIEQDEFGNVVEERDWGEVAHDDYGVGGDETITRRTFANNQEDWVLGRLATEEVADIDGNRLAAKKNYYDGDAFEGLPLGEITRGDITREEVWVGPEEDDFQLENSTKYNELGLPVETKNVRGGGRYFEWSDDQTSLLAETVKLESDVELIERAEVDSRFGNVTSVTTYNGQERRYTYDDFGRVTKVVEPGDTEELPTIEYRYEVASPLSRVVTLSRVQSGKEAVERSETVFDGLGRKRATLTQDEGKWVIAGVSFFDARGKAYRSVDPRWATDDEVEHPDFFADERSHYSWFDATGRTVHTFSPEGVESRTEYGVWEERHWDGGQTDEASPYEHTPTVTRSNAQGKVIEHRRTLDGEVLSASYVRDPLGQLVVRRDPEGNEQHYEHDGKGRLVRLVDPDMGEHRMAYDELDNLLVHEHPDGKTTEFSYDLADRVLTEDWDGDGEDELTYFYDELEKGESDDAQLGVGKLLRVEEPTGFIQHRYDERSQVVQTEYNIDGESYVVQSEFDAQGRERVHIYPDGSRIEIKRNGRGQLSGYGDAVEIEYRGDGLETMRRFNTGVEFKNRYDGDQRRREFEIFAANGDVLEHLRWDFDDGGNLLRIKDEREGISEEKDRSEEYTYDNLYRLVGARGTWGNTEWDYSPSGNLLSRESTIEAQNATDILYDKRPHAPEAYGDQEIEYDKRGRMESDGERKYTWNGTDQLVRVEKGARWTESEYGMDGVRRIRREHTDDGTKTTHFIDGWSEVKDGELVRYIVHAEKRIARLSPENGYEEMGSGGSLFSTDPRSENDRSSKLFDVSRDGDSLTEASALKEFVALTSNLPSTLIASLLLSILAGLAWLAWLRPAFARWSTHSSAPVRFALLLGAALTLAACSAQSTAGGDTTHESEEEDDDEGGGDDNKKEHKEEDGPWITHLSEKDTIFLTDLIGSSLGEANGQGKRKTEVALYPYGLARYDSSSETNVYADNPRDRSVGLDHMGARFYAPKLGIWTSADPAILVKPEQYVTAEFAAANPYAYANLRPVVAADRDGQFWHIAAGAAVGALVGGGVEAVRQYASTGKVEDWGRVAAAAGGGAVSGAMTAVNPGAGLATVMGSGAASNAAGGVATRLIESGGKSAGTLNDVAVDATVGAVTGGIVKGGSSLLRKVLPKKAAVPPSSKPKVGQVGDPGHATRLLPSGRTVPNAGGTIISFVSERPRAYYRVFSGDSTAGRFLTAVKPPSSAYAREGLALPPSNQASFLQEVIVPAGVRLQRSRALPAFGHRGGAEQFELLDKIPVENFGIGVKF